MRSLAEDAKIHVWKSGRCIVTQVSHICSKNTVTQSQWCLQTSLKTNKPMFSLSLRAIQWNYHACKHAYHTYTQRSICMRASTHIMHVRKQACTHFVHAYHAHMQVMYVSMHITHVRAHIMQVKNRSLMHASTQACTSCMKALLSHVQSCISRMYALTLCMQASISQAHMQAHISCSSMVLCWGLYTLSLTRSSCTCSDAFSSGAHAGLNLIQHKTPKAFMYTHVFLNANIYDIAIGAKPYCLTSRSRADRRTH